MVFFFVVIKRHEISGDCWDFNVFIIVTFATRHSLPISSGAKVKTNYCVCVCRFFLGCRCLFQYFWLEKCRVFSPLFTVIHRWARIECTFRKAISIYILICVVEFCATKRAITMSDSLKAEKIAAARKKVEKTDNFQCFRVEFL